MSYWKVKKNKKIKIEITHVKNEKEIFFFIPECYNNNNRHHSARLEFFVKLRQKFLFILFFFFLIDNVSVGKGRGEGEVEEEEVKEEELNS